MIIETNIPDGWVTVNGENYFKENHGETNLMQSRYSKIICKRFTNRR